MPKHENASATSVIREFGCTYPRNGAFTFARYEKVLAYSVPAKKRSMIAECSASVQPELSIDTQPL